MAMQASEVEVRRERRERDETRLGAPAWRAGFESLETEVREARELTVTGALPKELSGTLYRVGPARLDVYGDRFKSWFDGDGMVHALAIEGGRVTYVNRFVDTPGKAAEDRAKKRLYAGFATRGPGTPFARFQRRHDRKNPGNTNVLVHAGKLLALCEGGRPYRLDEKTLATFGEDDMSGQLTRGATYSAHPKLDRETGEMWNFGSVYGKKTQLEVYRTTATGETKRVTTVPLPVPAMVHDFALTKTKAIFIIAPMVIPRIPVGLILGQRSFAESLTWRPELGVNIAIVDRATFEVRWVKTEPFMMFHTVNAWDEGDDVVVDVCAYPDGSLMQTIEDVMDASVQKLTYAPSWPERLRIAKSGRITKTRVAKTPFEFPRVAGGVLGREHTRIYGVAWTEGSEFLGRPVAIDVATGRTEAATLRAGEFAGECVPVAKGAHGGTATEKDVWLLTLVLDGVSRRTELRVFDGEDLAAPPVATVKLPHVVPFGFHGNWTARRI